MSGRLPPAFIDELLSRIDIVDLIDSRVPLKKAGRDYAACCPFHSEKTASFTVSPNKQFYHCFGCGAHGTAIGFLMEYEHKGFMEAVEDLADRAGLEIPREGRDTRTRDAGHGGLYEALEQAAQWFQRQLRDHPAAPRAVDYLKRRGLTGEIARDFQIGYAPPGSDTLSRALAGGVPMDTLLAAGLVVRRDDGGTLDRFRDRVMFPIRDRRGRTVGFGGRVLDDDQPKYLNSPETPVFHKGRELYGYFEALRAVRKLERLVVVEGYMDVIALAQFGVRNVVAALGTATTGEQLRQLFRTAREVVFCFDGDRAGRQAAWRALENALPVLQAGREARFLFLPEGADPDSLIRSEGVAAFNARMGVSLPLSEYLFKALTEPVDLRSAEGKARLAEQAQPLLQRVTDRILRELMLARLATLTGLTQATLEPRGSATARMVQSQVRTAKPLDRLSLTGWPVRKALALLLYEPALAARVALPADLPELDLPGVPLLVQLLELLREDPNLRTAGHVLERFRGSAAEESLQRLAQWEPEIPTADLPAEFDGVMANLLQRLDAQRRERRRAYLVSKPLTELTDAEKTELRALASPAKRAAREIPQDFRTNRT